MLNFNDHQTDHIEALALYRALKNSAREFYALCRGTENFTNAREFLGERLDFDDAEAEYKRGYAMGAKFILRGSRDYPEALAHFDDQPPFLWALGRVELLSEPKLSVIGSRSPSIEGVRLTSHLAKLLNYESVVVVSGLALGIDAVAHEAALSYGTIAVLAGGVDVHYPKQNSALQDLIAEHGLLISEMPIGHQPKPQDFPRRNRIVAALSSGVLVTEAQIRSGTHITVRLARDYGREILAVPSSPFSPLSELPNQLIDDGAKLVRDIDDILVALPSLSPAFT